MNKDLRARVISAVFIVIFLGLMIFVSKYFLLLGTLILSIGSILEISRVLDEIKYKPIVIPAIIFNICALLLMFYVADVKIMYLLSLYLISLLIIMIFNENISINNVTASIFVAVYITIAYSYILYIKEPKWVVLLFGISSVTDTFAYLVGVKFGKTKLYEKLSPKKTIEGSIGGIIGALLFGLVYKVFFNIEINIIAFLLTILVMSIISQIGDLMASYIKRKAGVKDYGNLIKGHGGFMDRFDSILLITPILGIILNLMGVL